MKAAKLATSPRLRRVLDLLERSGGWLTTRRIVREAHVCAVNSIVAELRANDCEIECRVKVLSTGARRHQYRLASAPEGWRERTDG